jgi:hypothetical protein
LIYIDVAREFKATNAYCDVVGVAVGDDYAIEVEWTRAVLVREEERSWAGVDVYLCGVVYSKSTSVKNLIDGHVASTAASQKHEFYHVITTGKNKPHEITKYRCDVVEP